MSNPPPKRDPKEPTPLVLMNPELRVRQLRYAANIEASPMVPLHRYYEVLLDLSTMGLEYLKSMKLERAFIIFKRIEYFIFHRLKSHPGVNTFTSAAKTKIMSRVPMIMYVAQQIIVDYVMPVYERQAAYFRYEELQRRLKIINPTAWQSIMLEAAKREAQFYSEAEQISTRFGVELSSFMPQQVMPDDNHPSNYPPRTFPAKNTVTPNHIRGTAEEQAAHDALQAAINAMNSSVMCLPIAGDQPVEALIRNINAVMNDALNNFFTTRAQAASSTSADHHPSSQIQYTRPDDDVILVIPESADRRNTYSPRVDHMYRMPQVLTGTSQYIPPYALVDNQKYDYNPTYSLETYVDLLVKTFEFNSKTATGYRVIQMSAEQSKSKSTAGYLMKLEPVLTMMTSNSGVYSGASLVQGTSSGAASGAFGASGATVPGPSTSSLAHSGSSGIIPEPDPGPPRVAPPTQPVTSSSQPSESFGVWKKLGSARGPDGSLGSLGVLSDLDRAREVLDSVPPILPTTTGIQQRKRQTTEAGAGGNEENQSKRVSMGAYSATTSYNSGTSVPSSSSASTSQQ